MTDSESAGTDQSDLLERLATWAKDDDAHWAEWRRKARQSYAFVSSDQWSRDERRGWTRPNGFPPPSTASGRW
jgi:hypothetical protein